MEAERQRAVLATFAKRHAEMETLFEEFDRSMADALRIQAQFIRTELELGFTFLDGAKVRGSLGSQECIRNAITALRTVNRFLTMQPGLSNAALADIYQRRNQLRQHLHDILAEH